MFVGGVWRSTTILRKHRLFSPVMLSDVMFYFRLHHRHKRTHAFFVSLVSSLSSFGVIKNGCMSKVNSSFDLQALLGAWMAALLRVCMPAVCRNLSPLIDGYISFLTELAHQITWNQSVHFVSRERDFEAVRSFFLYFHLDFSMSMFVNREKESRESYQYHYQVLELYTSSLSLQSCIILYPVSKLESPLILPSSTLIPNGMNV